MNFFKKLFKSKPSVDLKTIIEEGAFLVDVRTTGEFASGNIKGSVNIPLDKILSQLEKFKNKKNIIVFCRSGMRSGQAKRILTQNGISNVFNGGPLDSVARLIK